MSAAAADSNRFPSQTKFILGNEASERFSYYGMKGILALYITNALLKDKDYATNVIHLFGFVNYFMPLLGAWVSDRFWGRYRTILWISLFYCAGHGVLAMSDVFQTVDGKVWCLFIGLGLIAFGSGGIRLQGLGLRPRRVEAPGFDQRANLARGVGRGFGHVEAAGIRAVPRSVARRLPITR